MVMELDANSLLELGMWLGRLEVDVNTQAEWGAIRLDLNPLCRYKQIKELDFIGSEAQGALSSLAKKYKGKDAELDDGDISVLNATHQQWNGKLDLILKNWILCLPQTQLDIGKLITGAKLFFEDSEWQTLNDLEKQGLDEAASSLLGNNFTSSEFMALRTVESVLRRWYEKKTGTEITNLRWGHVLDKLETVYPEKGRPNEISAIFHLNRRRNAIAHPDVISTEADASVTFIYVINVCKAVKNLLLTT